MATGLSCWKCLKPFKVGRSVCPECGYVTGYEAVKDCDCPFQDVSSRIRSYNPRIGPFGQILECARAKNTQGKEDIPEDERDLQA